MEEAGVQSLLWEWSICLLMRYNVLKGGKLHSAPPLPTHLFFIIFNHVPRWHHVLACCSPKDFMGKENLFSSGTPVLQTLSWHPNICNVHIGKTMLNSREMADPVVEPRRSFWAFSDSVGASNHSSLPQSQRLGARLLLCLQLLPQREGEELLA